MIQVNLSRFTWFKKFQYGLKILFSNAFSKSIIGFYFSLKNTQFFLQHIMMKSSRLEKGEKVEDNIIKDVRILFRLKREIDDTTIKDLRNLFGLKQE